MRQIILDTETTGLQPKEGHRIIEIGCVELVNRRFTGNNFHQYLNPQRLVDDGAIEVHGLTNEFLQDKPLYEEVAEAFYQYLKGAEVIIHNAAFDVGFIDHEYQLMGATYGEMATWSDVTDTLHMARKMFPGQRNSLDALCKRYEIDNSHRQLHGALLDAQILADVYLAMTGGQNSLFEEEQSVANEHLVREFDANRKPIPIIRANEAELATHQARLDSIEKSSGDCLWKSLSE